MAATQSSPAHLGQHTGQILSHPRSCTAVTVRETEEDSAARVFQDVIFLLDGPWLPAPSPPECTGGGEAGKRDLMKPFSLRKEEKNHWRFRLECLEPDTSLVFLHGASKCRTVQVADTTSHY